MAASIRAAIEANGSPQLGRAGFTIHGQCIGFKSVARSMRLPSKRLAGSMRRSSMCGSSPKAAVHGAADSRVRCRGELYSAVIGCPPSARAAASAMRWPSSLRP